jgi:hypothetical protein
VKKLCAGKVQSSANRRILIPTTTYESPIPKMAIFGKKNPVQELEAEHERLKRQCDRLASKTEAARSELDAATAAQLRLLTESEVDDLKSENAMQRRVDTAASALKALEAALANISEQVDIAERSAEELRASTERKAAADQIERQLAVFGKTFETALAQLRTASQAASELAHVTFEIDAIAKFAQATGSQLDVACSAAVHDLRNIAQSVREGQTRIPGKPATAVPVPMPVPVVERVWILKPLAWSQDGMIQIRDSNCWVDLPPALAQKAINKRAAAALGDDRAGKTVQTMRQSYGGGLPSLASCIRLDDETETALAEEKSRPEEQHVVVVRHSVADPNFQVIDRGEPFIVKTVAGNTAPTESTS